MLQRLKQFRDLSLLMINQNVWGGVVFQSHLEGERGHGSLQMASRQELGTVAYY